MRIDDVVLLLYYYTIVPVVSVIGYTVLLEFSISQSIPYIHDIFTSTVDAVPDTIDFSNGSLRSVAEVCDVVGRIHGVLSVVCYYYIYIIL
jgi:hypothetical protein